VCFSRLCRCGAAGPFLYHRGGQLLSFHSPQYVGRRLLFFLLPENSNRRRAARDLVFLFSPVVQVFRAVLCILAPREANPSGSCFFFLGLQFKLFVFSSF